MDRPADNGTGRQDRSDLRRQHGVGPEMYAVRARGKRHVRTIVDENLRAGPFDALHASPYHRDQSACVELALSNLNEVSACACCGGDELHDAVDRVRTPGHTPAIRHETDHDCSIVSIVSMRRRAIRTEASSWNPINRLTTPRPDTAPRT